MLGSGWAYLLEVASDLNVRTRNQGYRTRIVERSGSDPPWLVDHGGGCWKMIMMIMLLESSLGFAGWLTTQSLRRLAFSSLAAVKGLAGPGLPTTHP